MRCVLLSRYLTCALIYCLWFGVQDLEWLGAWQALAIEPPVVSKDKVFRVNVVNLTKLGKRHSFYVNSFAATMRTEHATYPEISVSLVFLPNTGKRGTVADEGVESAIDDFMAAVQDRFTLIVSQSRFVKNKKIANHVAEVSGPASVHAFQINTPNWVDAVSPNNDATLVDNLAPLPRDGQLTTCARLC